MTLLRAGRGEGEGERGRKVNKKKAGKEEGEGGQTRKKHPKNDGKEEGVKKDVECGGKGRGESLTKDEGGGCTRERKRESESCWGR